MRLLKHLKKGPGKGPCFVGINMNTIIQCVRVNLSLSTDDVPKNIKIAKVILKDFPKVFST